MLIHSTVDSNESIKDGKHRAPFWEKAAVVIALGLLVVNTFQMSSTKKAAQSAKDSAEWTQRQTQIIFEAQRPRLWVKKPVSFRVEIGEPITADVEVFNYGKAPTLARARMYVEVSTTALERFRKYPHPLSHPIPDIKGTQAILLAPDGSTTSFPIEPQRILTKDEYQLITIGVMDVVVYGRIDYSYLGNPWHERFNSIFCFYRMTDGTVSGCPNYNEHHFTNFTN